MKTYTEAELNSLKLAAITAIYNDFVEYCEDAKAVKKFRDKPTAIKRTLDMQEQAVKTDQEVQATAAKVEAELAEKKPTEKTEPTKTKSTKPASKGVRFDMTQSISIVKGEPKEGTIEYTIFQAINEALCTTAGEVVDYILANHKRPRSDQKVDTQYAVHNIKWFTKKGHLQLTQA